ncbi:MAG: hypothetical protein LWX07_00975 [Bacteroidetes bacterium]|nr:hypothetical protein [Bacteroidota bacterium]
MNKKILHIAPQNFAGMPLDFARMQSENGYNARLVTIFRNTIDFDEDLSLNFTLPVSKTAKKWRDSKITGMKYYKPKNILESVYFKLRDFKNSGTIEKFIDENKLYDYDVYHFDGGMDFYRDLRFAKELDKLGKKIVCCYFGSDLRTRGIFRELDGMSSLNLTVEFDHLRLHKNIHYLFFPYDVKETEFSFRKNEKLRIIHSPTNRLYKGTDRILPVIEKLKRKYDFDFILAENISREKLLELKRECDLAIDQVGGVMGGSGYGKNSIENLSMGLPTITEFYDEYLEFIPENPFICCDIDTLKDTLKNILENRETLKDYSEKGRVWVEKYHSFESVNRKLDALYRESGI